MTTGRLYAFRIAALVTLFAVAGCSGSKTATFLDVEGFGPDQIYERGEYEVDRGRFADAAFFFSEVERLYPYSEWAQRAMMMQAYAHHENRAYDETRAAAQRFIDFYPAEEDAAYAQFLIGLSYYDQIADVGRDQKITRQALQAFRIVIEQYPDSEYARSANLKFDLAFDHLAGKEMEVGRYYLGRKNYAAAINRFRNVVESFQTTTHTAEALHRLVEAYLSLGLTDQAQTAGAILGHNFQSTEWYDSSYKLLTDQGLEPRLIGTGWLQKVHRQVLKGQWL